jgi:hypothetical protein
MEEIRKAQRLEIPDRKELSPMLIDTASSSPVQHRGDHHDDGFDVPLSPVKKKISLKELMARKKDTDSSSDNLYAKIGASGNEMMITPIVEETPEALEKSVDDGYFPESPFAFAGKVNQQYPEYVKEAPAVEEPVMRASPAKYIEEPRISIKTDYRDTRSSAHRMSSGGEASEEEGEMRESPAKRISSDRGREDSRESNQRRNSRRQSMSPVRAGWDRPADHRVNRISNRSNSETARTNSPSSPMKDKRMSFPPNNFDQHPPRNRTPSFDYSPRGGRGRGGGYNNVANDRSYNYEHQGQGYDQGQGQGYERYDSGGVGPRRYDRPPYDDHFAGGGRGDFRGRGRGRGRGDYGRGQQHGFGRGGINSYLC